MQSTELGQQSSYDNTRNPDRLVAIPRLAKRKEIGLSNDKLPFNGVDIWTHYEVSWLNPKGKPQVAIAQISYDCHSENIVESKSLKLYFNSLNNTHFKNNTEFQAAVKQDLENCLQTPIELKLLSLSTPTNDMLQNNFPGICLDELDVECSTYTVDKSFLHAEGDVVAECLTSNLLKSNCLVTNQPDWGSVQIDYRGPQINHAGLLQYIVSFRNHNEFHEQCIERIFVDILQQCQPEALTVYGRYTRRGGIDINPFRTNQDNPSPTFQARLIRQ